jgi:hypothetical protein
VPKAAEHYKPIKLKDMSNDEILEANKLIAEFMGGEKHWLNGVSEPFNDDTIWGFYNIGVNIVSTYSGRKIALVKDIKYNNSWDWLMPVVEKIESGGYCVFIQNDCCWIKVGRAGMKMPYITNLSDSKIESTYKSCVEIIKWIKSKVLAEM